MKNLFSGRFRVIRFGIPGFFLLLRVVSLMAATDDIIVSRIGFSGNESISDRELRGRILTRPNEIYNPQTAQEDCERIATFYQQRGFYNIRVNYPDTLPVGPWEVEVRFFIEEEEPYLIRDIHLSGNSYFSAERIAQLTGIYPSGSYSLDSVNSLLYQIVDLYASRGYLFARAELDSLVVRDDGGIAAFINIDEGRFGRFERFIYEGNKTTRDKTLLRISGLDQMELFSLYNLRQAEENVRRKEYIREFSIIPINHQTLLLQLEEDRMTRISGMLGYDSSQNVSGSRLTGFIDLKFLNLYGTDRELAFSWKQLRADRQSVEFRYHESGPFAFPVAGDFKLFRETVDSTYVKTTLDSEIYYYTLRNKYGIYLGSDDYFPGTRRPKVIEKSSHKKIGAFWYYNSEDYHLNPTKGMRLDIKHYYIMKRKEGDWVNKQATEIKWNNYFALSPRLILMSSLNGKQIQNRDLETYELYTLGGTGNLRGFREEQFSGHRIGWSNLELRYLLARKSRVFLFADYGVVQQQTENGIVTLNDLFGIGFGIRLDTRLGLIGVDYGVSHSNGEWLHPLDGMIHFGLEAGL